MLYVPQYAEEYTVQSVRLARTIVSIARVDLSPEIRRHKINAYIVLYVIRCCIFKLSERNMDWNGQNTMEIFTYYLDT